MRRSERGGFWIWLAACVVRPLSWLLARRRWSGQEHVPRQGPAILVANHVCVLDPVILAHFVYASGRVPRFMATSGLWRIVGLGSVLRGAGQIPVYRDSPDASDSLRAAVSALQAGKVLVIYPEGGVTRDPDYWPMRARTGLARLALATGAPVVPLAVWGPQQIWGRDRRFRPLPRKAVSVSAGPVLDLSAYSDGEPTAEVLREVTDMAMASVRDMVGRVRGEAAPRDVWNPVSGFREPVGTTATIPVGVPPVDLPVQPTSDPESDPDVGRRPA